MSAQVPFSEPFDRFAGNFAEAKQAIPVDPNGMVLSSVDERGRPSSRVVLLKDFDSRGFVFYTNLQSRKGRELLGQRYAALCFWWAPLERQVRIEGTVEQVPDEEADAYFASRERGKQFGAWASLQSQLLESRAVLEARVEELDQKYAGVPIPRPPHWSGLRVVPDRFEFWQGRVSRLHERDEYVREGEGWRKQLLHP